MRRREEKRSWKRGLEEEEEEENCDEMCMQWLIGCLRF